MKRRGLLIALLIVGFLVPVALINAQQRSGEQGERSRSLHEGRAFHEMPGLDLSDEQKSQIREIRLGVQKEILSKQNQLNENRARMKTLTTAENPDMDEINKLIDQSSGIRADIQKVRAAAHQEVRKTLNEDQRVMFDSRSSRMMARKHHQGHRMRQGERMNKGWDKHQEE